MIKTIIVDDEAKSASIIKLLLSKYCPQVKVLGIYEGVAAAKAAMKEHKPELIFLDIEMPNQNGFQLLEETRELDFEVVFITAFNHYAIQAIKANALDYLLKPVEIDELIQVVEKAERKIKKSQFLKFEHIEEMIKGISNKINRKIALPLFDGIMMVEVDEIISLEADSNYTYVYLINNKKITVSRTLKFFEKQLEDNPFIRVHNSHIINLLQVEKYIRGDGGTLVMKNGLAIPVSRTYKKNLQTELKIEMI